LLNVDENRVSQRRTIIVKIISTVVFKQMLSLFVQHVYQEKMASAILTSGKLKFQNLKRE
jgi:hypothetical protein